ncbi:hypothetical protein PENPOL_c017G10460 [Penicillium polonicum]|uniref:Uncharacterized protein n=1 Tax=Penicillium polonicum TaxID=60169 RepID=A0A1V6N9A0_PENPO|nr:hypothetical protein PENPOL_c017G10460 [Penicillium polonicum]
MNNKYSSSYFEFRATKQTFVSSTLRKVRRVTCLPVLAPSKFGAELWDDLSSE